MVCNVARHLSAQSVERHRALADKYKIWQRELEESKADIARRADASRRGSHGLGTSPSRHEEDRVESSGREDEREGMDESPGGKEESKENGEHSEREGDKQER